ncbi:MAG: DNA ligase [Pirellulaceae bacterium]|nr:DNA ligase [Pirellulaceae bacterium]
MPDLADGETIEMKGSAKLPYVLKNTGGVYSCSCPAWRNQSVAIERRTCKHLKKLRGETAEAARIGQPAVVAASMTAGAATVTGDPAGPPILLAETWTNDSDLAGWWMSEKLDGVRAYWDGRQFLSRQGNVYHAPDWFLAGLPATPLDGELWLARKAFQRTVSIVRRQDKSDHWREISYLVFDAPAAGGGFEERTAALRDSLASLDVPHIRPLEHERCRGVEHLRRELARIEALGGEGLMLRQPGSLYEAGRSATLLKVKTFHDAEARVVDHSAGTGRHKGRLGALVVELADGTQFSVGTGFSDAERRSPPPVGTLITFRYQELSDRGVPRFPSFVRAGGQGGQASLLAASQADPPAATKTPRVQPASPSRRYFEFTSGGSGKFWEISQDGASVTVRFGKIGADGQSQTKSFPDIAAATRHAEKLIAEKAAKGYAEK